MRAKAGADDQDRTGDLVLTKDALCQLSYIGLRRSHSVSTRGYGRQVGPCLVDTCHRSGLPTEAHARCQRERRLERETGIEPATNSLEGCDSTTELLPPSRLAASRAITRRSPLGRVLAGVHSTPPSTLARTSTVRPRHGELGSPTERARKRERRLVAREGLEPSKPLGRQIYSLLRLTASLPRQLSVVLECAAVRRLPCRPEVSSSLELAKGFEPPTC